MTSEINSPPTISTSSCVDVGTEGCDLRPTAGTGASMITDIFFAADNGGGTCAFEDTAGVLDDLGGGGGGGRAGRDANEGGRAAGAPGVGRDGAAGIPADAARSPVFATLTGGMMPRGSWSGLMVLDALRTSGVNVSRTIGGATRVMGR